MGLCSDPTQKSILTADLFPSKWGSEDKTEIFANYIQISTASENNGFWKFPSGTWIYFELIEHCKWITHMVYKYFLNIKLCLLCEDQEVGGRGYDPPGKSQS